MKEPEELNYDVFRLMRNRMGIVKTLLEKRPFLRGAHMDNVLYAYFLHYFHGVPWEVEQTPNGTVSDIFIRVRVFGKYNYPGLKNLTPLETVSRARRKIQEKYVNLRGSPQSQLTREEYNQAYRDVMVNI